MSARALDALPHAEPAAALERDACLHCGLPIPTGSAVKGEFCCRGCSTVYAFLRAEGLTRYYDLGGGQGAPAAELRLETRDRTWLEPLEAEVQQATAPRTLALDVQGIHCSACVWLIETLTERMAGPGRVLVNPALGRLELSADREFPLRAWVEQLEGAGYALAPATRERSGATDGLLLRLGVAAAIAGNAMMFAIAIYLGLREGPVFELVHTLGFVLALASVLVGGPVFFRGAWRSVRAGSLHFDVPISLGILLAFTGSTLAFFGGRDAVYFDSVSVFVALMLLGRYLRERALERNRRIVLESVGAEHILTRREGAQGFEVVRITEIREGDLLRVARGELMPVEATLLEADASFSLDWINGESEPRTFKQGDTIPAGAFCSGSRVVRARALGPFSSSTLLTLLREHAGSTLEKDADGWWDRISRRYVRAVLVLGAGVFAGWWFFSGDVWRALEATTATLVITCPCSFGLAAPMAYELAMAGLRRAGVFVRRASFLDRARAVRRVVFDKTGTITTGLLSVGNPEALDALSDEERRVLYALSAQNSHPKSVAIRRALEDRRGRITPLELEVHDEPGLGVEARLGGAVYRVGSLRWCGGDGAPPANDAPSDVCFARGGQVLLRLETFEALRRDAREEIAALQAHGYAVHLLSGDRADRVRALAAEVGIARDHIEGDASPDAKAAWVRARDRQDTLMVGDGINDGPAAEAAWCSATPAVDRPFMPGRTDFYWTSPGLTPISLALRVSERLAQVLRGLLTFAWTYNALAIALAAAGLMKPWLAAVLMPASSIAVLVGTRAALGSHARVWPTRPRATSAPGILSAFRTPPVSHEV